MISRVCSFERSSSSSSNSSGTCSGSGLSSSEDAAYAPDSTSASEDMVVDGDGTDHAQSDDIGAVLQKTTTHYLLQLYPCQLLVGPHLSSKVSARDGKQQGKRRGENGGSSAKDKEMYVIG